MKALSVHPYPALAISEGGKSIECRTWNTNYRGDLLIVSTQTKLHGTIPGHALCVVDLYDCVPFKREHIKGAMMRPSDYKPGLFAWKLRNNRIIKPIPLKGKLSLWDYDGPIEYIPNDILGYVPLDELQEDETDEPAEEGHAQWFIDNWEPIMV